MKGSSESAQSVRWKYHDIGEEVLVTIDVSSVKADSFDVEIGGDSLSVHSKKGAAQSALLSITQLYSTVDAAASDWNLLPDKTGLIVRLKKLDLAAKWPQLEAETPTKKLDAAPRDPLEARKSVEALLKAARAGDVEAFRGAALRFNTSDLGEVKDANGHTALHFAASEGQTDFVRYLINEQQFQVDTADDSGDTPLALAAASGHHSTVLALLDAGASAVGTGKESPHPIHWAAQSGDVKIVELLIEHGASVDSACSTGTPLVWSLGAQKRECAAFLLDNGASPNGRGDNGVSACLLAAATGSEELLQRLVDMGADVNARAINDVTPLHVAAESGQEGTVKILLKGGANPDAKEERTGARPIDEAAAAQHREIVGMLLPRTSPAEGAEWTVDALLAQAAAAAAAHGHTHEHGGGCCGHDHSHDEEEQIVVPPPEEYDLEKAKVLKRKGDEAFVKGQFPAAVEHYTGALRHNTSDHALWANRSAAAFRTGQFQEALLDARRARTIHPRYAKAYFREGSAAEALEHWEDAAQAYFQGCRLDPNNVALAKAFHGVVEKARAEHAKKHAHAHTHGHLHGDSCGEGCGHEH